MNFASQAVCQWHGCSLSQSHSRPSFAECSCPVCTDLTLSANSPSNLEPRCSGVPFCCLAHPPRESLSCSPLHTHSCMHTGVQGIRLSVVCCSHSSLRNEVVCPLLSLVGRCPRWTKKTPADDHCPIQQLSSPYST